MAQCTFCGAENDAKQTFCSDCEKHGWLDPAEATAGGPSASSGSPQSVVVDVVRGTSPTTASKPSRKPVVKSAAPEYLFHTPSNQTQVEPIEQERDLPWSEAGVSARDDGHEIFLLVDSHEAFVEPGQPATFTVNVRNSGKFVERVIIEVQGLPGQWWTVSQPELNLDLGLANAVTVTITPPRDHRTRPGRQSFNFVARIAAHPGVRCVDSASIDIASFADVAATLEPPSAETRGEERFDVVVTNHGNRAVQGRLEFAGESVRAHSFHSEIALEPGQSSTTPLVVSCTDRLVTGQPVDHAFTLTVKTTGSPDSSPAPGMIRQPPLLGRLAYRAVLLAVVLLLVVTGLVGRSLWNGRAQPVPDVVGDAVAAATQKLEGAGFTVETVLASSADVDADVVISQVPAAETDHKPGTVIALTVSSGPIMFAIGDFTNTTAESAIAIMEGQGLVVTRELESSETIGLDGVIAQVPEPGTLVSADDSVTLTVSTGLPKVAVPFVEGQLEADAAAVLRGAGLQVQPVVVPDPGTGAGRVVDQRPDAGTEVDKGSFVSIDIARASGG